MTSSAPNPTPSELLSASPDGLDTIQWKTSVGSLRTATATSALLHEDFASAVQVRTGVEYQNRPNRHTYQYFAPQRTHVFCESALEADNLLNLEHSGLVARVASQPMLMLFRAGSKVLRHFPDFFAVHTNGDLVVYNVKPAARMNDKVRDQFDETARVCAAIGWRHEVLHEPHPVKNRNLQCLRAARHARYHPDEETFERIRSVFDEPRPGVDGARMVNLRLPPVAFAHIRHLLWHGYLDTDLSVPFGSESVLRTSTKGTSCNCAA